MAYRGRVKKIIMTMTGTIKKLLGRTDELELKMKLENQAVLTGRLFAQINKSREKEIINDIHQSEFKVFSQWGDDGMIQLLVNYLDIPKAAEKFVEFGVENYREANTRFLLINNNWSGLVIDGSKENIDYVK